MTSRRALGALLCAVTVAFNQPIVAWAQETPAGQRSAATIPGRLVDVDGKTTWRGQLIRVVSAETGELVSQATTGEDGRFQLPELAPGEYLVSVGQVVSRLLVTSEQPVRELRLIVPAKSLQGETIPLADLRQVEVTGYTVIIVGGIVMLVAMTATGFFIWGYNYRDTRGRTVFVPVSPFTP